MHNRHRVGLDVCVSNRPASVGFRAYDYILNPKKKKHLQTPGKYPLAPFPQAMCDPVGLQGMVALVVQQG